MEKTPPVHEVLLVQMLELLTIIMTSHIHTSVIRKKIFGQFPVIEDLTDYQDGTTGNQYKENYSVGTLYMVTVCNGVIEKISLSTIRIYPYQSLSREQTLHDASLINQNKETLNYPDNNKMIPAPQSS